MAPADSGFRVVQFFCSKASRKGDKNETTPARCSSSLRHRPHLAGCINTTSTAPKAANHVYLDYNTSAGIPNTPEIVDFDPSGCCSPATLNDVPEDVIITAVATDTRGYIYAALYNTGDLTSEVAVFAPGSTGNAGPIRRFHSGFMTIPIAQLTVDPSGNVYVYDYSENLFKFTPNASGVAQPLLMLSNITAGAGMTTDSQGNFYISIDGAGPSGDDAIYVYSAGFNNTTPQKIIVPPVAEFIDGLAVDQSGNIYASGERDGSGGGFIEAYAPTATGSSTPIRTITGPNTLLTGTGDAYNTMAIDAAGTLYMRSLDDFAPGGTSIINEFPSTADGNVAPAVSISAVSPCTNPT